MKEDFASECVQYRVDEVIRPRCPLLKLAAIISQALERRATLWVPTCLSANCHLAIKALPWMICYIRLPVIPTGRPSESRLALPENRKNPGSVNFRSFMSHVSFYFLNIPLVLNQAAVVVIIRLVHK
jgi:hypothetical protein